MRVVMHEVGGNFGTRGSFNPEFALVAWAARRVGRPVKWTCERSEAFLCDYQARDLAVEAELALDRDGNFLAMRGSNIANVGAYPISYGPLAKGVEIMSSIYHVPAVHFRARAAITNTLPTRPYRSSGRPEVMFVMERLIDLAARQCGFDRLELRRRNLVPEVGDAVPQPVRHGLRQRRLPPGHGAGRRARRLGRVSGPAGGGAERAANTAASASAIMSTPRPGPRASAPKSPYCPRASSRSSSAPCRTARGTRRALRS